jgi:hypothetical protein
VSVSESGEGCPSCGTANPTAPVPVEDGTVLLCEGCAVAHMSDQLDAEELAALSAEVEA